MLKINICTEKEKEYAYEIREKVFVYEQGFSLEIERDEYDEEAVHVVGYENGLPVACGRIVKMEDKIKLGRIAVLKEHRGKGYGMDICRFMVNESLKEKPSEIYLNSQLHAAEFYKKLGFRTEGDIFLEEDAEHIRMVYDCVECARQFN